VTGKQGFLGFQIDLLWAVGGGEGRSGKGAQDFPAWKGRVARVE
jgi:hypothetical protein